MNKTKEELIELIQSSSSMKNAAKTLGIDRKSLYRIRLKLGILNVPANTKSKIETTEKVTERSVEQGQIELAKQRNIELQRQIKLLQKDLALKDEELNGIWAIKNSIDYKGRNQPDWLTFSNGSNKVLSIPTLMCSDEHWGEVVFENQVNGMNKYNTEIARKRYNNVINNFLKVTHEELTNVDKERMVMILGGDAVSGDIHEELTQTNDLTVMESVMDYVDHKVKGIKSILDSGYKQIFIACVAGNHDRATRKTFSKNRNETSFAFIIYRILQKVFADDKRISFSVAGGIDCLYKVHNHRMLLTHGDQFKGGNGIGGITIPILRGFHKKLGSLNSTNNAFDSMVLGHFHQFSSILNGQVIINGSLKGFDEYSLKMGFQYQDPCQAFWLTHPQRGITIQLPIFTDSKEELNEKKLIESDWISWKK